MLALAVVPQSVAQTQDNLRRETERQVLPKPLERHSSTRGKVRRSHLDHLERKLAVIRDRVRGGPYPSRKGDRCLPCPSSARHLISIAAIAVFGKPDCGPPLPPHIPIFFSTTKR